MLRLGRWSWLGHGTKIRVHEGVCEIGAKTVLGQECTISAFQHVSIGRECVIADRVMLIDFDHGVVEVERPIRLQGIYKRDVRVGSNCWIGYGACILRGVSVGDNAVIGTNTVVTKDLPANAVAGGTPARVLRMREAPERCGGSERRADRAARSSTCWRSARRARRSARPTPRGRLIPRAFAPLMDPVRRVARDLVERGELEVTQKGRVVDIDTARGPIRLRSSRRS